MCDVSVYVCQYDDGIQLFVPFDSSRHILINRLSPNYNDKRFIGVTRRLYNYHRIEIIFNSLLPQFETPPPYIYKINITHTHIHINVFQEFTELIEISSPYCCV